ncbi:MAG: NADH-quinone oxidoreductase subunit J [Bacteroidetes bacterium]|nr:NADH-quinone oxidoreductase subunit J [Bacteroidota bacterium]
MTVYDIIFYLFALISVGSAFFVVTLRNIVYSAFFLLFTLFGIAGLFVLLSADFIAVVQLVVYVGAILVLILFGVMLTSNITQVKIKTSSLQIIPSAIAVLILAFSLIKIFLNTNWKTVPLTVQSSSVEGLGVLLLNQYSVVFELIGILLLIALIGAASMARR